MEWNNPFTPVIGMKPEYHIERQEKKAILQDLEQTGLAMVTGEKGMGKTVLVNEIKGIYGRDNLVVMDESISPSIFYTLQAQKRTVLLMAGPRDKTGRQVKSHTLKPLDMEEMARIYQREFDLLEPEAMAMAETTKGYPYAFQLLGSLTWKNHNDWKNNLGNTRMLLCRNCYDDIWRRLEPKEREQLKAIRNKREVTDTASIEERGLVKQDGQGNWVFLLPWFDFYVSLQD